MEIARRVMERLRERPALLAVAQENLARWSSRNANKRQAEGRGSALASLAPLREPPGEVIPQPSHPRNHALE